MNCREDAIAALRALGETRGKAESLWSRVAEGNPGLAELQTAEALRLLLAARQSYGINPPPIVPTEITPAEPAVQHSRQIVPELAENPADTLAVRVARDAGRWLATAVLAVLVFFGTLFWTIAHGLWVAAFGVPKRAKAIVARVGQRRWTKGRNQ